MIAKLLSSVNWTTSGVGSGSHRAFWTAYGLIDTIILLLSYDMSCFVDGT